MDLTRHECLGKCDWKRAGSEVDSPFVRELEPILICSGCGSQWAPSESWLPRQADGSAPPDVEAAKQEYVSTLAFDRSNKTTGQTTGGILGGVTMTDIEMPLPVADESLENKGGGTGSGSW